MRDRIRGTGWSMELLAGWSVVLQQQAPFWAGPHENPCIALVAPGRDAALRAFTWYDNRGGSAQEAAKMTVELLSLRGISAVPAQCGDFSGYEAKEFARGDHWHHWWLAAGPVPLTLVYRSNSTAAGRDDAGLNRMLRTLRSRPLSHWLHRVGKRLGGG
jgi:hypothetical protein